MLINTNLNYNTTSFQKCKKLIEGLGQIELPTNQKLKFDKNMAWLSYIIYEGIHLLQNIPLKYAVTKTKTTAKINFTLNLLHPISQMIGIAFFKPHIHT